MYFLAFWWKYHWWLFLSFHMAINQRYFMLWLAPNRRKAITWFKINQYTCFPSASQGLSQSLLATTIPMVLLTKHIQQIQNWKFDYRLFHVGAKVAVTNLVIKIGAHCKQDQHRHWIESCVNCMSPCCDQVLECLVVNTNQLGMAGMISSFLPTSRGWISTSLR